MVPTCWFLCSLTGNAPIWSKTVREKGRVVSFRCWMEMDGPFLTLRTLVYPNTPCQRDLSRQLPGEPLTVPGEPGNWQLVL